MRMTRREVLGAGAALALVGCPAPPPTEPATVPRTLPPTPPPTEPPEPTLEERVAAQLPTVRSCFEEAELSAVEVLGAQILDLNLVMPEAMFEPVLALLESSPGSTEGLEDLQLADFAALRVLDVHGWTLSWSECALAAMLVF